MTTLQVYLAFICVVLLFILVRVYKPTKPHTNDFKVQRIEKKRYFVRDVKCKRMSPMFTNVKDAKKFAQSGFYNGLDFVFIWKEKIDNEGNIEIYPIFKYFVKQDSFINNRFEELPDFENKF